MADPWQVASFAIETIGKLLIEEARFLARVEGQVKLLQGELRLMQANLRDAEEKNIESQVVQVWISDVKNIAYDVEDLVEKYAFRVGSLKNGGFNKFLNRSCAPLFSGCYDRHNIGLEIQPLNSRISILKQDFIANGVEGKMEKEAGSSLMPPNLRKTHSFVGEEDFVGLHQDVDMLVQHLVSRDEHRPHYKVVSITGMGGLGKTTIANKVYNHPTVKRHFNGLVWICVSQQWQTKDILQRVLIKLLPGMKEDIITKWEEEEMLRNLLQVQQEKKCLIVLDDIWRTDVWDCIKAAFPHGKSSSNKILVTTRNREVALYISPDGFHHEPRLLDGDESLKLLQRKSKRETYSGGDSKDFEILGMKLVKHCAGLPLAVIVLGGILLTKNTLSEWEMVHQNIKSYLWKGKSLEKGEVKRILDLSYYELPYHLKPCFLYLGSFPEDTEIDANTVYQLWMAEGMLLNDGVGKESSMELAEQYLAELGQRSMVQLQMSKFPGLSRRFKSCRLHDFMRELCLLEANHEGFLTYIDQGTDPFDALSESSSLKHRRLVINLVDQDDLSEYIPPKTDIMKYLRMFQFNISTAHSDDNDHQPIGNLIASQLNNFEMLRVLRIEGCNGKNYGKLPKAIGKLFHLRYLSLRHSVFSSLPSSLGNLKHLQTLYLDLKSFGLRLPNILWKMKGLTCLYMPHHIELKQSQSRIRLDVLNKLEILENFNDDACETEDLLHLTNLRVFHGECNSLENLILIVNYIHGSTRLEHVTITTSCDFNIDRESGFMVIKQLLLARNIHFWVNDGPMWKFPEYESGMASCLVELRMYNNGLDIENICRTIQQFPHLARLSVDRAIGKEVCFSAKSFPKLEELFFANLMELEKWVVKEGALPDLHTLTICDCPLLGELPDGLSSVKNLAQLVLGGVTMEFKEKIKADGGEDFHKIRHVPLVSFIGSFL